MTKELNCKWHFDPQAKGNERGPNNPTALTFKGTKYHSLIRESIQNSLDAVYDRTQPVIVSFSYHSFSWREFPHFFVLKEHIEGCLNKYPNDENAKKLFLPMLKYFGRGFSLDNNIGYLRVVDYNTTGMHYDRNDGSSPFNAFISEGIASKPNGAGGSFGFGKAVFWMLSPISTVFVSSKTDNNVFFEGQTKLCTHINDDGQLLSPNGLYDTDGLGEVITQEDCIPEYFRPTEKGTSVFVLGCPEISDEIKNELIMAVLRNFWMAIHRNKLIVNIEDIEISKNNLSRLMEEYFEQENNNEKEIFEYNPRPFYEIVVNAENGNEGYKIFKKEITINNNSCLVNLFIHKLHDANGQFVFMRKPLMIVYSERFSSCKGAEGVFICEDEFGNSFLREMEDCSHDSWTRKNYEARNDTPSIVATRAINNIKTFIKNVVSEEIKGDTIDVEQVSGLEKILTISTPGDTDKSKKDEIIDPVFYLEKKKKEHPKDKKRKPSIRQPKVVKAIFDANGRLRSNSGTRRKKRRKIKGPIKPGSLINISREDDNGKEGIYATPIDVSYRTWSQIENNNVWHLIRIFSDKEIENALIQVYGVDEEGRTLGLNIERIVGDYELRVGEGFEDYTDFDDTLADSNSSTKQVKNAIGKVKINANIPLTLKIKFNSSIKYSLRINSDMIETNEK